MNIFNVVIKNTDDLIISFNTFFYKNNIKTSKDIINDIEYNEILAELDLMDENRLNNEYIINDKLYNYEHIIKKYINEIYKKNDYIIVENQEKIYKNDIKYIEKIIKDTIECKYSKYVIYCKTIFRNKIFNNLFDIIMLFNTLEYKRMKFIDSLQKMNVNMFFENVDKIYIEQNNKIFINLYKCGIPNLLIFNYIMTFEQKKCEICFENNKLFLYYLLDNNVYKIELHDNNFSIYSIYNNYYIDINSEYDTHNIGLMKNNGYFAHKIDIEKKYLENIFKYHNINIFEKLKQKYKRKNVNVFFVKNELYLILE